ncbi:6624_t:CDS:2 [Ambispora gerdemannii]|uniref:6624_t:CDS:1 n=1 Tax=Ambispora gerdemannii TaxID=144530 RepID=A0A9N9D0W2_9GLOM|nr:6624_t:CDS:2 [Ambispora gerdemannii]
MVVDKTPTAFRRKNTEVNKTIFLVFTIAEVLPRFMVIYKIREYTKLTFSNCIFLFMGKEYSYYLDKADEITQEQIDAIGKISTWFSLIQFFLMCYLVNVFTEQNNQNTDSADKPAGCFSNRFIVAAAPVILIMVFVRTCK